MTTERYRAGDLLVDAAKGTVTHRSHPLDLPPLSFALLVSLLRHAPEVVRRNDLIDDVWEGALVSDETLSQRVRLLRESLGDDAGRPRYVASVRGWGYRFVAPVELLGDGGPTATTIAVLPFVNLGGRPEDEPLCEGLSESIIGTLTRVRGLRVIARTSSFAIGRTGVDVCEAGRRLGTGWILEGSVQPAGRRVRVAVQLVETAEGAHLWSERYDRELRDVLELEDEIADEVARRVREDLAADEVTRRRPAVDPDAYQAYLQGRYHLARVSPEELALAQVCLERSIAADPGFALAFDALAELYWYLGFFGGADPRTVFGQSTWYALRALELDESLADTHALLAMLRKELDYNWPEVDREITRARELNPSSPAVRLRYAISALLPHCRFDEALAEVDEVLASDPLSLFVRWWSGALAYLARQSGRTIAEGRYMVELDGSHFLGHWLVGMGHELEGDLKTAVAEMERARDLGGDVPFTLGFLSYVLGKAGRRDEVRAILKQLQGARASTYISPMASALGHVGLEEWDEALDLMETAVEQRDPLIIPIKSFHYYDSIRDDPRFVALLEKMNLS